MLLNSGIQREVTLAITGQNLGPVIQQGSFGDIDDQRGGNLGVTCQAMAVGNGIGSEQPDFTFGGGTMGAVDTDFALAAGSASTARRIQSEAGGGGGIEQARSRLHMNRTSGWLKSNFKFPVCHRRVDFLEKPIA